MKAALICPSDRPEVPLLAADTPLALTQALGMSILEYWLSHLAGVGVKEVVLLAHERQEEIWKVAGNGSRWGLTVHHVSESRELTRQQASEKHLAESFVMDHFPGLPEFPLFGSYEGWYKALERWVPCALQADRVGIRQVKPGVWVGVHSQIAKTAKLIGPCWIGDRVLIGANAVIGPGTIIENGAFVDPRAEIKQSIVGPHTFVGLYVQINHSIAWGSNLINWQTGSQSTVSDAFLLSSLRPHRVTSARPVTLMDRVADWIARWTETQPMQSQPILISSAGERSGSAAMALGQKG